MDAYSKFSEIYDLLMTDVPYAKIAEIIDLKLKKHQIKNNLILDLACGTGSLTKELSEKGYDMIGADSSYEMLEKAREKNPGILLLNQSMENFELYGTVGAIVCSLDSINYILDDEDLNKTFKNCNNYLEPGGIFIFDINTEHKFKNILADNIFTYDSDEIFYAWENNYSEKEKLCDFYLTFFVKEKENYSKFCEVHTERVYSEKEIERALKNNGFKVLEKLDDFTGNKSHKKSERIMYVCKVIDSIQEKNMRGE